jgi:hypothetical protein
MAQIDYNNGYVPIGSMKLNDLPFAEYYCLVDDRFEELSLYNNNQCEDHNALGPTTETLQIRKHRQALVDKHPRLPRTVEELWEERSLPLSSEMIHQVSNYRTRLPARLDHTETIIDYANNWNYTVVSREWKSAIEAEELGVHEFYPHRLVFMDVTVSDRFIFRSRVAISDAFEAIANINPAVVSAVDEIISKLGGNPPLDSDCAHALDSVRLHLRRVRGFHLWFDAGFSKTFVSKSLASRLLPFLPERTALIPVQTV